MHFEKHGHLTISIPQVAMFFDFWYFHFLCKFVILNEHGSGAFFKENSWQNTLFTIPLQTWLKTGTPIFDDGDHLRLTHCGSKNMKIDDILIFRRASGVKRPEMTPKTGFSCLKTDLHQMLGLKAILKEEKVISILDIA